jgi:hypothetical protein
MAVRCRLCPAEDADPAARAISAFTVLKFLPKSPI